MMEKFTLKKRVALDELRAELVEYEHACGARIMHIAADDDEKLFCLSLQTHPDSSNGVAHILEHTVLCGSHKFPVKDPFFMMIRRSLNTFMNAMTGSDFTCYPAATQIEKDFYNLLDVYIDAVFAPNLEPLAFKQEGHRLDFEGKDLVYKGVVFNEMKGYKSGADGRIWHKLMEELFPDTTYRVDSGGDPVNIPELSYDEFIAFHKKYYHPSRCLFFSYGNLDLDKHLKYLDERILASSARLEPIAPIPPQPRFAKPVHTTNRYPTNDDDAKHFVSFAYLTCPLVNQEELLGLSLLESVLMENDAAPLKMALQNSGLCVQADSHLDTEMSEAPLVLICRGCGPSSGDAIEKLLNETLERCAKEGFSNELIEACLHQMELSRLEISGDSSPYGLTLFFRSALTAQHGGDPEKTLKIHSLFQALRDKLAQGGYLEELIRTYLLNNPHRVRLDTAPDLALEKEEDSDEKMRLSSLLKQMSDFEREQVRAEAKALEAYQDEDDGDEIECLPKLSLDDVPKQVKDYPLIVSGGRFSHDCFTNGMVYGSVHMALPEMVESELFDLALLVNVMSEVGAAGRTYQENLQAVMAVTGGISASCSLYRHSENGHLSPRISLYGKALDRNGDKLANLMQEIAGQFRLDEKGRIKELISQMHTMMDERIKRRPIGYAMGRSLSAFSNEGRIKYLMQGLPFFDYLDDIVDDFDGQLDGVISRLERMREKVIDLSCCDVVISGDEKCFPFEANGAKASWKGDIAVPAVENGYKEIPSGVAFTCMALPCVGFDHPLSGALHIASELMEHKVLHPKIREQGGAYGGRAAYGPLSETFYFYAYQDPHLKRTLGVFREAIESIGQMKFDERELEEAKLSYIQDIDSPTGPGSRATLSYGYHMRGRTLEKRQAYRESVLGVSKKMVAQACQELLAAALEQSVITTLAGKEMLEKERCDFKKINKTLPLIGVEK